MSWLVAEIPVNESVGEAVADALYAAGADGVAEEWRPVGGHVVRAFWKDAQRNDVLSEVEEAMHGLRDVGLLDTVPEISLSTMDDADWLEGWKQHFSPVAITPRLAVAPSWEAFIPAPGQEVVIMDPGMAFGTGTHGTTFTCLQALSGHLLPGMRVCDVGTGSGILAIAAAKLGAAVTAVDNDALAIRVAGENIARNAAPGIACRIANLLDGVDGPFDMVIANILAPVIEQLVPDLARVLAPEGLFVSSGYIVDQESGIRSALVKACHEVVARYEREGWVTLVSRYRQGEDEL